MVNRRVTALFLLFVLVTCRRATAQAEDQARALKDDHPTELPVALLVQKSDGAGRRNRLKVSVRVSLTDIQERLEALGNGRMRVTVTFEITGSKSVVHEVERDLPRVEIGDYWLLEETVRKPKRAIRISALAQELVTGSSGAASASLEAAEVP